MYLSVLIALTAALTVSAAPEASNEAPGTQVSLVNRRSLQIRDPSTGRVHLPAYLAELDHTLTKYGAAPLPAELQPHISSYRALLKRQSNEPLIDDLVDDEDRLYYGMGTVGSQQPQTFLFDFDTGSADTFVPGPRCGMSQGCAGNTRYSETGTNLKTNTTITYGSGQVSGVNFIDAVTVAGLTAGRHNVVSLTEASGFAGSKFDSLMGMAFQRISSSKQPPFFQTLINEGKVSTPEFAFYLGRAQSQTQNVSQLTLGGRDRSKYTGTPTEIPVVSESYWQVALDAITVNGKPVVGTSGGQAAIDTGTSLVIVPSKAAKAIFAQVPGSFPLPLVSGNSDILVYGYPCIFNGSVALQFAGQQFAINALDFNFGKLAGDGLQSLGLDKLLIGTGGGICIAGIAAGDINPGQNLYVIGDSFLKNWYSIYSFAGSHGGPSVSFAAAAINNQ